MRNSDSGLEIQAVGIINILYIFKKLLFMPFRIWQKKLFAKSKCKYFATHEKIQLLQQTLQM